LVVAVALVGLACGGQEARLAQARDGVVTGSIIGGLDGAGCNVFICLLTLTDSRETTVFSKGCKESAVSGILVPSGGRMNHANRLTDVRLW
jgi:hypothetical protein